MKIQLVKNAVFWLNSFLSQDEESSKHLPCRTIIGFEISYENHIRIPFGKYVKNHEITQTICPNDQWVQYAWVQPEIVKVDIDFYASHQDLESDGIIGHQCHTTGRHKPCQLNWPTPKYAVKAYLYQ